MADREHQEPIETYTDYYSYGGYQFEITAIHIHDDALREAYQGEWNVTVNCPEQPQLNLQFEPSDLGDADTRDQVVGRARDAIARYVDQHPDVRPTEVP